MSDEFSFRVHFQYDRYPGRQHPFPVTRLLRPVALEQWGSGIFSGEMLKHWHDNFFFLSYEYDDPFRDLY